MTNSQEELKIRMVVNESFYGYMENGKAVFASVMSLGMDKIKYMSEDAIRNWINEAILLTEEVLEWKKDIPLKKRLNVYKKNLDYCNGRENLMLLFTNIVLSCEDMSTLPGFGMANVSKSKGSTKSRSKIWLNPEKRSYRSV
jgi:hypothetical protein